MRVACSKTKTKNTHSEYVLLIAFPQRRWLGENAALFSYTNIVCLLLCTLHRQHPESKILEYNSVFLVYDGRQRLIESRHFQTMSSHIFSDQYNLFFYPLTRRHIPEGVKAGKLQNSQSPQFLCLWPEVVTGCPKKCLAQCNNFIQPQINPLNTKRRQLYLNTQIAPRSKHFASRL